MAYPSILFNIYLLIMHMCYFKLLDLLLSWDKMTVTMLMSEKNVYVLIKLWHQIALSLDFSLLL